MSFSAKVYVVQKADEEGKLGELLAVKLTHAAAHAIALKFAPAKVHFVIADKSVAPNVDQLLRRATCS